MNERERVRILVAAGAFKQSLTASEACAAIARGLGESAWALLSSNCRSPMAGMARWMLFWRPAASGYPCQWWIH